MNLKNKKTGQSTTLLRVISKTKDKVNVLFPSLDVPVEMTKTYFEYLKKSGDFLIHYDTPMAS